MGNKRSSSSRQGYNQSYNNRDRDESYGRQAQREPGNERTRFTNEGIYGGGEQSQYQPSGSGSRWGSENMSGYSQNYGEDQNTRFPESRWGSDKENRGHRLGEETNWNIDDEEVGYGEGGWERDEDEDDDNDNEYERTSRLGTDSNWDDDDEEDDEDEDEDRDFSLEQRSHWNEDEDQDEDDQDRNYRSPSQNANLHRYDQGDNQRRNTRQNDRYGW